VKPGNTNKFCLICIRENNGTLDDVNKK
jgi:hypothetical protein